MLVTIYDQFAGFFRSLIKQKSLYQIASTADWFIEERQFIPKVGRKGGGPAIQESIVYCLF